MNGNLKAFLKIVLLSLLLLTVLIIILVYNKISVSSFDFLSLKEVTEDSNFISNIDFGQEISNRTMAIECAEKAWATVENFEIQKPYKVSYDDLSNVWLIQDHLPKNNMGGCHNVLLSRNGKVLAIWGEK